MRIFGPKLRRKGSLQLSINAIVILILAITILGLGLGFIKKQFSSLGEQFESVSAEIKSEIIEKIRQSGELLVFNKIEFNVQAGQPDQFYIGVKNTGEEANFRIAIECIQSLSTTFCEDVQLVGGVQPDEFRQTDPDYIWFKLFGQVSIGSGEVGVYPVTLQLPGKVPPDTYLMTLNVYREDPTAGYTQYTQPKQFYINVR